MNTAVKVQEVKIKKITVTEDTITAQLMDGRTISVPLAWSWRLSEATPKQRANWEIIGDGHGVHWPDVDEDISAVPGSNRGISKIFDLLPLRNVTLDGKAVSSRLINQLHGFVCRLHVDIGNQNFPP